MVNNSQNYNNYNCVPGAAGGRGRGQNKWLQQSASTQRDGRKDDPTHQCCGNKPNIDIHK